MRENKFKIKPKRPKALWTQIKSPGFKAQREALRPENGASGGGIKARSDSETRRMEIYRPLAELYKRLHPVCEACPKLGNENPNPAEDIHHKKGRAGLLLFDSRHWLAVCRQCHLFINNSPAKARELGLDESHKI